MTWQDRGELRADPGIAPGSRNIDPPRRRSIWPSIAVVAAALAFGGVIWFAYQSGKSGNGGLPPLVKADTGPTKVKPENPGGQEIPFQDSTVYDRLDQNGQKPVVEKLLPETETPVTRPPPAPVPNEATVLAPQAGGQAPSVLPQGNGVVVAPAASDSAATALAPPGSNLALPPAPPIQQQVSPAPQPQVVPQQSQVAATPQAKPINPPPAARPAPKPAADSIAALIGASEAGVPPPQHAPAAAGGTGYRLRLSAVRSPAAVADEWARLKRRYPELASLRNTTSKIDLPDKGTFYRIEAGPLSEGEAKSTCDRLRTQGLGCIVVKP
ncbi:MAG TPA: SPOR domain-containing protein [Alphaproteobacteria bacterium]|nr:SPOR domain-containing protein [Alphaproteobacteria bacterium]